MSHKKELPVIYSKASTTFVVMPEEFEISLCQAFDALDGILSMMKSASANAGESPQMQIKPESLSALLEMVLEKIKPATSNPLIGTMREIRPDLFSTK